jgi:hypothetical protein
MSHFKANAILKKASETNLLTARYGRGGLPQDYRKAMLLWKLAATMEKQPRKILRALSQFSLMFSSFARRSYFAESSRTSTANSSALPPTGS